MDKAVFYKRKKKLPEAKYNTWQNTSYILNSAWKRDKHVIFTILAQCLLIPAIAAVAMFLPPTVVALITDNADATRLLIVVLAFTLATVLLYTAKSYLDNTSQPRRSGLRGRVCGDILEKAITTDYANLENKKFTDAKQKAHDITSNNSVSTEQVYYTLEKLGSNLLGFIFYIALLIRVNPLILILTASTTVIGFFVRRWANRWQFDHDDENAEYEKRTWYIANLGENNSVAKDIRLFSMLDWLNDVYNRYLALKYNWQKRVQTRHYLADIADCASTFLREGAAYVYLIWQVLYHDLPVDQLVLLFAAIGGFSGWIMGILNDYSTLQRHSLDYCRLREYLEFPDQFKREDGLHIAPQSGKTYTLELRNVSFRYPGAHKDTLQKVNLTISAEEKLAVVGLNGAGKTTLVKLLCGFYDPTAGEVLLDGCDIRSYNREDYYSLFTAVFQEFNILPVSISENIAQVSKTDLDQDKIDHCLELADLAKKIHALPDGSRSLLVKSVNEEAVELSGGETQRLMLARALYKDSSILILDEPTAALDPLAESRLYERYNELSAGKTSIYISHRLASTRFCDRIIFIDNKTIAEAGTHEQLLAAKGKYADLYKIQSKYYQKEVEA